ncbi:hypothetical protein WG66_012432 [Moniliophthora roreri]|uniref:Uncharacterized protein n=1 Tax=Moniliophthora roreri TaxID=221103 RepID=A0A0W0EWI0_MONRR|nr:hypothetical protein WG66_012432 [Moniliophthora roreri]
MPSAKGSILKPSLEAPQAPVQLCDQCLRSYSPALDIQKATKYLEDHAANHIPLDHELPYIRETLQDTLAEIDRLDSELGRLRDTVRQMKDRRKHLRKIAFRLNGMATTTIRRLPPELLCRIFFIARDDSEDMRTCRVPLILSHVCGHWRALVHSQPGLWCIIDAEFRAENDQVSAASLPGFTKFCLEKSQPKAINITLVTADDKRDLHEEVLIELLEHTNRWKVANFLLWPRYKRLFTDDEGDFPIVEFPILERLVMGFLTRNEDKDITISAPRLSSMHLHTLNYRFLRMINLEALTTLTIQDYDMDSLLHILQLSPNLSDVCLTGWRNSRSQQFESHSITSHVKCLRVELLSAGGDFFEQLSLPSLAKLQIMDTPGLYDSLDRPQLCQFISRSRPPITHLILSTTALSHDEVMGTLALLQTITDLKLGDGFLMWDSADVDDFLRRMTVGPESIDNILLPNLENLGLAFRTRVKGQIGNLMGMLESRCLVAHGLRQKLVVLRLVFWKANCGIARSRRKLIRQRIDVLRDDGLDAEIEFY